MCYKIKCYNYNQQISYQINSKPDIYQYFFPIFKLSTIKESKITIDKP